MPFYSENQVRQLHSEFRSLKKYVDKLSFFDRLFGIVPFSFPDFDPQLGILFQKEKTGMLAEIFRKERNNPSLSEKKFYFGEHFVFNIKPANSNSSVYSHYILSIFMERAPVFEDWIRQKKSSEKPIEFFLEEANENMNRIENCLQHEYDKSFRLQCMSVFYKGFFVAFSNQGHAPDKKRKFTELYLYAQGMIYANYITSLKTALQKSRNPVDLHRTASLDLMGKLELMQELGIIDFLRTHYAGMDPVSFENKIAEILCLITGEYSDQKETVVKMLGAARKQQSVGITKQQPSELRRRILQLTTGK
jgi:hypothetical protein